MHKELKILKKLKKKGQQNKQPTSYRTTTIEEEPDRGTTTTPRSFGMKGEGNVSQSGKTLAAASLSHLLLMRSSVQHAYSMHGFFYLVGKKIRHLPINEFFWEFREFSDKI